MVSVLKRTIKGNVRRVPLSLTNLSESNPFGSEGESGLVSIAAANKDVFQ